MRKRRFLSTLLLCFGVAGAAAPAKAISLEEALRITVLTNPNISEAIFSRRAIEFELEQARGLWGPQIDLEGRVGLEYVDNSTTRAPGVRKDYTPAEIAVRLRQRVYDHGRTNAEIFNQAARVDGAAARVQERSEFIALQTARTYIEMLRLVQLEQIALENLRFHRETLSDVREGAGQGVLSIADVEQVQERIFAAEVQLASFREDRAVAETEFIELVGRPPAGLKDARRLANVLPKSIDAAVDVARRENPLIELRRRDIDSAQALVDGAEAAFGPEVDLEVVGLGGYDIARRPGDAAEAGAFLTFNWTLYDSGIRNAQRGEQIERMSESRMLLHSSSREVEREIREAWVQRRWLGEQLDLLRSQVAETRQLLNSYQEQFSVGERSLLDVLDTQNSLTGTEAARVTAEYAIVFAEYRIVAAMGRLLSTFGLRPPSDATSDVGDRIGVPRAPVAEDQPRDRWKFVREDR